MPISNTIINYLSTTYSPSAIIVYGSFADGSAGAASDFDALLIADSSQQHDSSVIDGTVLDVFLYPPETFQKPYDPETFIQVHDGIILLDQDGFATGLKSRVQEFIAQAPRKTPEELQQEIDWCKKMLVRTARGDAEGYFRWHWLLCDSLEIYFDIKQLYYFGPKKSLRSMTKSDPESYRIYSRALKDWNQASLSEWIACLENQLQKPL